MLLLLVVYMECTRQLLICTDFIPIRSLERLFSVVTLPEVISVGLYLSEKQQTAANTDPNTSSYVLYRLQQTLIPTPPPMSCTDCSKHGSSRALVHESKRLWVRVPQAELNFLLSFLSTCHLSSTPFCLPFFIQLGVESGVRCAITEGPTQ